MKINQLWPLCVVLTVIGCSEVAEQEPECFTENARQCGDQGKTVQICKSGFWSLTEPCPSGTLCNNNTLVCESTAAVCSNGDRLCSSNILMECQNGKYVNLITCGVNEVCNQQSKSCVPKSSDNFICEDNKFTCESNNLYRCSGNAWQLIQSCPTSTQCNANSQTCDKAIECQGGDKKCDSDYSRVMTCTDGFWKVTEMCEANSECNPSSLICQIGCVENQVKCDVINHALMKCSSGVWNVSQDCSKSNMVCNAQTNACEAKPECVTGTRKCASDSAWSLCINGHWETGSSCSSNEKCIAGDCAATCTGENCEQASCEEGAVCEDNVLKVCENGSLFEKVCEPYQICNAASKSCDAKPECTSGGYRCFGFELQQCSIDGKWTAIKKCVGNEVCDETQHACIDTSECQSGEAYCDSANNKLMTCGSNGKWQESKTCQSTEICNAQTKSCDLKPVCTSGAFQCNGLELQKCSDTGQWETNKTCSQSQICDKNLKNCLDCTPNTYECTGQTLRKCNAGTWETSASCTDTQTCSADKKKCLDCTGSGYQCSGQNLQQCNNYAWKTLKTCSSNETCDASQKTCINNSECTDGQYSCQDKTLRKCVSGSWTTDKTCSDTENCNSEKKACVPKPVCESGQKQCSENQLMTCSSEGQWESSDCGTSALCVAKDSSASCVQKMTLPDWCNFQGVDNKRRGYARVLMPNDVEIEDVAATFVCGRLYEPIINWSYSAEAVYNKNCTDCYANTEFMSYSLSAPSGTHTCTYRFDFGPQSFVCINGSEGGEPVVLSSDTLIGQNGYNLTVPPLSAFTPTWCYFKHYDTSTNYAYGRIWLGDTEVPANVKAKLICGDITKPASTWTVISDSKENLFCDNCGSNVEYMVNASSLASGSYACAFRFDVDGRAYVCPTYRDDYNYNTGGAPIELTSDKMLNSMNTKNNDDPITVWDVVK